MSCMNARKHGGQASQATRRREDWIICTDCTTHSPRRVQAAPETAETPVDFVRALAVGVLLAAAGYAMVIALAGYAG